MHKDWTNIKFSDEESCWGVVYEKFPDIEILIPGCSNEMDSATIRKATHLTNHMKEHIDKAIDYLSCFIKSDIWEDKEGWSVHTFSFESNNCLEVYLIHEEDVYGDWKLKAHLPSEDGVRLGVYAYHFSRRQM